MAGILIWTDFRRDLGVFGGSGAETTLGERNWVRSVFWPFPIVNWHVNSQKSGKTFGKIIF
jgi:hypothetical protein